MRRPLGVRPCYTGVMRSAQGPRVHMFVCANQREGSPLGDGCAGRGEALYAALKSEVAKRGHVTTVWVTKTHCLGICPKVGATCARYGAGSPGEAVLCDVTPEDAPRLVDEAEEAMRAPRTPAWSEIEHELLATEELQTKKVIDLARRLKPGLTNEDIQNPHDFPELHDPDWHYADGILTGMKSITSALRALALRTPKEPARR